MAHARAAAGGDLNEEREIMRARKKAAPRGSYRILGAKRLRVANPKFRTKLRASEAGYRHRGPRSTCAYCDEVAECVDHAVPASWAQGATALLASCELVKLSSCLDCNSRAGAVVDVTFADRRARIHASLLKANRKALAVSRMEDDELAELGPSMRSAVLKLEREADRVRRRLAILASTDRPEGVPADFLVVREDP